MKIERAISLKRLITKTFIILQVCILALIFTNTTADAAGDGDLKRLTLGVKAGLTYLPDIDGFTAVGNGWVYRLEGNTSSVGAVFAKVALTENISIEGEIAAEGDSDVEITTQSIAAEYNFTGNQLGFNPFIKAGVVRGDVSIDKFSGDFDTEIGWIVGGGTSYNFNSIVLLGEVIYRDLSIEYNDRIYAAFSDDEIDLSGFLFKVGIGYRF